jgi:3-oxoacyl-[acyl-carrier protein] reductase
VTEDVRRICLITGAAGGIGLETAKVLAPSCSTMILVDRAGAITDAAAEIGREGHVNAVPMQTDLSDADAVIALAESALKDFGRVDILVNNAGMHPQSADGPIDIASSSIAEWRAVFAVNLHAPFLLCQALLPAMREKRWGRVVNIASRAGETPSPLSSPSYTATKAGLLGLSRRLALEVAGSDVTVNCVAPGPIATARTQHVFELKRSTYDELIPLGRRGTPQEVAAAVAYLVSDDAAFTTGSVLDVNGGSYMC